MGGQHAAGTGGRAGGAAMVVISRRALLEGVREESVPQGSLLGAAPSAMWLPPRLRLRPDGDGLVLTGSGLQRLVGDGFEGVLEAGRVDDALSDGDGAWLLSGRALRRVPDDLSGPEGAWERLLGDASATFAVARRPLTVVCALDGSPASRPRRARPVMDGAGRIAWVDASRTWNVLSPDGASREWNSGRAPRACRSGSTQRGGISRAGDGADGDRARRLGGLELRRRRHRARAGRQRDRRARRRRRAGADERHRARAPRRRPLRRVAADRRLRRLPAWGGEGASGPGVLARFDASGAFLEVSDPAPEDARLRGWWPAAARDWQVDGSGRAQLTLAGPDGVLVVTIQG